MSSLNQIFVLVFLVSLSLIPNVLIKIKIRNLRAAGKYPIAGNETKEDAIRLLEQGERNLAIYCYRIAEKTSLRVAADEIGRIEKLIKY